MNKPNKTDPSGDLFGSLLRIEHGWLTIRTDTGWLEDLTANKGTDLLEVVSTVATEYAARGT